MVLNSCSGYTSYIDDPKKVSNDLKTKSTIEQNKKTEVDKTEIDKIKIREKVVYYLNKKLEKSRKYGALLPESYREVLIRWKLPSLQIAQYLFFGFYTSKPGDEQKVACSLIRKQNSDQSCYLLDGSSVVKANNEKGYKSRIRRAYCINKPFCIAATIDGSCGYYIDLAPQKNKNKNSLPVYKCYEDGKIEICAPNVSCFLKSCQSAINSNHADSH